MAQVPDPVGDGFVASLARPGGNITGLSALGPELSGKRLELLKETVPKLSRMAVLGTSTAPGNAQQLREVELAAEALKVKLQFLDVLDAKDIETAFRAASNGHAEGVLVLSASAFVSRRTQVLDLAQKSRLPAIYYRPEFVEAGGLTARDDDVYLETHELGRECGKAIQFPLGRSPLNDNVFSVHVTKLAQTLLECLAGARVSGRAGTA
jgi:putative ABC transport system substrate-binding protein